MSVRVAVRVRPFNSRETKLGCQCVVDMNDPQTILKAANGEQQKRFTFDYSFWSFDQFKEEQDGLLVPTASKYADQKQVYERIGTSILDNAWQGYHCCLFAYGQTGSGKSYSMIGYGVNKGIVPITCNEIFNRIANKKDANIDYEVYASMLEIYNEEIQDLTIPISKRSSGGLKIRENKLLGTYVDGVKKHFVTNFEEIQNVMEEGTKNRTVAATQMNATSSRAHTIITIEFKQINKSTKAEKISMINLVDLAGSQRQDKTGATGDRLKEAVGINQSLTALGQVISILAENSDGGNKFVPYRNSALTRILQNALGGNSQTIMICAISPASDNYEENLSTLRYADRAKKIKNKPVVNESAQDKMIRELKEENERLKKLMEGKGVDPNVNVQQGGGVSKEQQQKNEEELKKIEQEKKKLEEERQKLEEQRKKMEAQEDRENEEANKKREEELQKIEAEKQKLEVERKRIEEEKAKLQEIKRIEEEKAKQQEAKRLQQQQQRKDQKDDDDDDIDVIMANLKNIERKLDEELKSKEEKKKEAKIDLASLFSDQSNNTGRSVNGKVLKEMEKQGKSFPYFENISKDLMIHRKLKILIEKEEYTIGKTGTNPPNDIVFGGRDMMPFHAVLTRVDNKVFIRPKQMGCHLYVNGWKAVDTVELKHLDRVIFGWNSVYLFKNKDDQRTDETINSSKITWDFCKEEVAHLVDIDQSDDEEGGGACCEIY